jgi:hypothetical protein
MQTRVMKAGLNSVKEKLMNKCLQKFCYYESAT